jgi:hypothetical protein
VQLVRGPLNYGVNNFIDNGDLNLAGLAAGIFVIRVSVDGSLATLKIIKL